MYVMGYMMGILGRGIAIDESTCQGVPYHGGLTILGGPPELGPGLSPGDDMAARVGRSGLDEAVASLSADYRCVVTGRVSSSLLRLGGLDGLFCQEARASESIYGSRTAARRAPTS